MDPLRKADDDAQVAAIHFLFAARYSSSTARGLAEVGEAFQRWRQAEDEFERAANAWLWYSDETASWLAKREPSVTWETLDRRPSGRASRSRQTPAVREARSIRCSAWATAVILTSGGCGR
jgi:hypothetical protein